MGPQQFLGTQARKVVQSLEEKKCGEALLLSKRIKICEYASSLYERASTMANQELHRVLQQLVSEGVTLPLGLQLKLVKRRCLEVMESNLGDFMVAWRIWEVENEDNDEFSPLRPCLYSLRNAAIDKTLELDRAEMNDEANTAELTEKRNLLILDWKDGTCLKNDVYFSRFVRRFGARLLRTYLPIYSFDLSIYFFDIKIEEKTRPRPLPGVGPALGI